MKNLNDRFSGKELRQIKKDLEGCKIKPAVVRGIKHYRKRIRIVRENVVVTTLRLAMKEHYKKIFYVEASVKDLVLAVRLTGIPANPKNVIKFTGFKK